MTKWDVIIEIALSTITVTILILFSIVVWTGDYTMSDKFLLQAVLFVFGLFISMGDYNYGKCQKRN